VSYQVGGLDLPLPTAGDLAITDPVLVRLVDYLAFWVTYGIGAKGVLQRPAEITNVLPAGNRFYYDPRGTWVRDPKPAFYLWWPDKQRSKKVSRGLAQAFRERELRLLYVLAEVQYPDGARVYSGLAGAIDALMHQASQEGRHPAYGYGGATPGTPIAHSIAEPGAFEWEYLGGQPDFLVPRPSPSERQSANGGGVILRGYPVLMGTISVRERIDGDDDAIELMPDVPVTATTEDGLTIIERILPAPDGADTDA
jgi:hypothetical protein